MNQYIGVYNHWIWTSVRSDVYSMQHIWSCQDWKKKAVRDRPFNLQGGGVWFSVLFRNLFSDNTRVRIFIFLSIRLFFLFPPPKSEYFFSVTLGIRIFFLEKKHNPPLLQVKWSERQCMTKRKRTKRLTIVDKYNTRH